MTGWDWATLIITVASVSVMAGILIGMRVTHRRCERQHGAEAWDAGYRNGYSIGFADDPTASTNYDNPYR
jgi:hypothetical protein